MFFSVQNVIKLNLLLPVLCGKSFYFKFLISNIHGGEFCILTFRTFWKASLNVQLRGPHEIFKLGVLISLEFSFSLHHESPTYCFFIVLCGKCFSYFWERYCIIAFFTTSQWAYLLKFFPLISNSLLNMRFLIKIDPEL